MIVQAGGPGSIGSDGFALFHSSNAGMGVVSPLRRRRLTSGASSISAGTDFFPSLRPAIKAGRLYRFEYHLLFTKNTAGTVTFQLKNSAGVNFTHLMAVATITTALTSSGGLLSTGSLAAVGNVVSTAVSAGATATFGATASLGASGNFLGVVRGLCVPVSDTRLSIAPSAYGAGTITTVAGSLVTIEDLGVYTADYGDFA